MIRDTDETFAMLDVKVVRSELKDSSEVDIHSVICRLVRSSWVA